MDDLQWIREIKVTEIIPNKRYVIKNITDIDQFNAKLYQLYGEEFINKCLNAVPDVPNMIINTINNDYLEKHIKTQPITISFVESHSERYGMDIVETGWTCDYSWYEKNYPESITLSATDFLSTYRNRL
jgi:hypothetical protein